MVDRIRATGDVLGIDVLSLLGVRAAAAGLHRRGLVSCGGATCLLPARDDWVALCRARPSDVDLLPAWLGPARGDGLRRAISDRPLAGHESVAIDLGAPRDVELLGALIGRADVVVESSRPRALAQLGIDALTTAAQVWVSITGHGRAQPMAVGFGDDAAVAGGL